MTGLASGQGSPAGTEFNLTTIEPDDETINTLIEAVDSAVTSLQSAAGTTTDSSFPSFDYGSWEVSWDWFKAFDWPISRVQISCFICAQLSSLISTIWQDYDYEKQPGEDVITGNGNGDFGDYSDYFDSSEYEELGGPEQDPDDLNNLPGLLEWSW